MLKKLQIAIRKLAPTDRCRWVIFSPFEELTAAQFATRTFNLGVSLNKGEVVAIWKHVGINSDVFYFDDFVRLLYFDMSPTDFDDSSYTHFFSLLCSRKCPLLRAFSQADPEQSGFINFEDFSAICESVLPQAPKVGISKIMEQYDTMGNGHLNYFLLMSDINTAIVKTTEAGPVNTFSSPKANKIVPSLSSSAPAQYFTPQKSDIRRPGFGGRSGLDPEIFPEAQILESQRESYSFSKTHTQPSTPHFRSYNELEKPKIEMRSPKPIFQTYEPPSRALQAETTKLETIKNHIDNIGSAQSFFHKWQTNMHLLTPAEIHEGLLNDADVNIPVEAIAQVFPPSMTLGEFVSIIGKETKQEPKIEAEIVDFDAMQQQIRENVVLERIAEKTLNTDWEARLADTHTANEFVLGLRQMSIYICLSDVVNIYQKLGPQGMMAAIRSHQSVLYQNQ